MSRIETHLIAQRIFGVGLMGLIFVTMIGAQQSPVAKLLSQSERIPVLLFGIDAADASQHTDTLMVSVLDPLSNTLSLLSIPRDTRVRLSGYLFKRVNEIYGYHMRQKKDPVLASLEVKNGIEEILSSPELKIPIPYFIQVDYSGFMKIVDLLGGVWVSIKQPMNYDDNAGHYHFHKEPGRYLLKGQEALFYVRFRGQTGDRGRIFRQQEFLRLVLKRMANPLNVLKFPSMVTAVVDSVRTNLSIWDLIYMAASARRLRSPDIGCYILPGAPRGVFWAYRQEAATALASHLILGKPLNQELAINSIVPQSERITVKVWNASGKKNYGYLLTKYLRKCGYDVVEWGTYPAEQIATRVIDRRGKIMNAQSLATELGIDNYHSEPNPKELVDVEIVIGKDFKSILNLEE